VRIRIEDFQIGDRAEENMWAHGIEPRQLYEMLCRRMTVVANRKDRAAGYIAIGRDASGRCIAVPVLPTSAPTIWRHITAWYC
jgi:hypothetical protein